MKYRVLLKNQIQLYESMTSGQLFRWCLVDGYFWGVLNHTPLGILQTGAAEIVVDSPRDMTGELLSFLRDDDDLMLIQRKIARDSKIRTVIQSYPGLRIFRQDPWECFISFLCSQFSNIPKISRTLRLITQKWGKPISYNDKIFHKFPAPEILANTTPRSLKTTSLGFRARYLLKAARFIATQSNYFSVLKKDSYEDARNELMKLNGVGPKVADCVLLFSLEKLEAFPVDIWIKKIMTEWYSNGEKMDEERIARFGRSYFGSFAGYAQQLLYYQRRIHPVLLSTV